MKVRKGWLVSLNKDTKKMTPFFVNVRSQDIVTTDPIEITSALKQTSTRWKLVRTEDRVECTFYHYEASWETSSDVNAEAVGSSFMEGYLDYYLYKDGRMEIDGKLRADGEYTAMRDNYAYTNTLVYLPFAFSNTPEVTVEYALGSCENVTLAATVEDAKITNQKLNLNGKDEADYTFALRIHNVIPLNDDLLASVPINKIRRVADSSDTYKDCDYLTYVKKYFPCRVHYKGYWRSHESVVVDTPESQDDSLTGSYATIAPVNMYASANTKSEKIRTLATKTTVQCSGYYTEVDGEKFLYVFYAPTAQYGYIHSSYLIKK